MAYSDVFTGVASLNSQSPPRAADAGDRSPGWAAGTTGATGPSGNSTDWSRVVHRALRGHYQRTMGLAVLLGMIGAAVGWLMAGPLYRSEGMVRIASALPAVLAPTDENQPIPMFQSFIQAQQGIVSSRQVFKSWRDH